MNFRLDTQPSFIEDKIKNTLKSLSNTFQIRAHQIEAGNPENPDDLQDIADLSEMFERNIKIIRRLIVSYLEQLGRKTSMLQFEELMDDFQGNRLFDEELTDDDFYTVSKVVSEIWSFLTPYEFVNTDYSELMMKNKGLEYLDRILRNTEHIIQHEKKEPYTEPMVYSAVKFYLTTVIPSAEEPTNVFLKSFNHYAPDIVLPELHAAVEYKYVRDRKKLTEIMGQLLADAQQYTGNEQFLFFYAVIYLTSSIISEDEFKSYWESYEFPKNWRPILVYGRDYRKK